MDEQTRELIKRYAKEGYSYRQIARMLGITHPTVRRALGKDRTEELYKRRYQTLPEDIKKLLGLVKAGEFGSRARAYEILRVLLRKYGITNLNTFYRLVRFSEPLKNEWDQDRLIKWLRGLGLSYERIGRLVGLSKPTVMRRLKPKKSKYQRILENLSEEARQEVLKAAKGKVPIFRVYQNIRNEVDMSLTTFYRFIRWTADRW